MMKPLSNAWRGALLAAVLGTALSGCMGDDCRPSRGWGNSNYHGHDHCRGDHHHRRYGY